MAGGNAKIVLKRQRDGVPTVEDFALADGPMPQPGPDQILVRNIYLSLDPFIRKAMRGDHHGYAALNPGDVIYGRNVARVVRSNHPAFSVGDVIVANTDWQQYAVIDGARVGTRVDPSLGPLSTAIGVLGMPGLTAWASVMHLIQPALGSTFVVSAAAGPVGAICGQLAKRAGARVVGIAGSAEKCQLVTRTYGFDACVNYKTNDWEDALKAANAKFYSSINFSRAFTPIQLGAFVGKRAKLKGLVVYDYEQDFPEYLRIAAPLVRDGKLKVKEDHVSGLENAPAHFVRRIKGENVGKAIVAVGPEKGS